MKLSTQKLKDLKLITLENPRNIYGGDPGSSNDDKDGDIDKGKIKLPKHGRVY